MLNYTESTHAITTVPPLPVLCAQHQEGLTEPPPEMTKKRGKEAGQADAKQVLAQAEQRKGTPLTQPEIREAVWPLFLARLEEMETSNKPRAWYNGWCCGYTQALLDAERTAAPEQPTSMADLQPEVLPVPGTITFRKATIETESMDDLKLGIICGQDSYVDLSAESPFIKSHDLAHLFAETMNCDEPEAFNVGFLLGLVDALLRARKTYPRGW